MYNLASSQNTLNLQNSLLGGQTQKNPLISQTQSLNPNSSQFVPAKKGRNPPVQNNILEQEVMGSQKKKIKTEEDSKESEHSQSLLEQANKLTELNLVNAFNPGNGNRDLFNSALLNNLLASTATQQKSEITNLNTSSLMIPFLQTPQPNSNQQNALLSNQLSQMVSQSSKFKTNQGINSGEIKSKGDTNSGADAFIKEFQSRILGLLFTQNKMLIDLKEKNEILQDTLACLIKEINSLKTAIKQGGQEKVSMSNSNPLIMHQIIGNSAEAVTVENLVTYLYGSNADFQYNLVLKSDLQLPLYRERNFKFTVILTDKNGKPIENSNRIPLTIGIYSSENPPKYIDSNTAGNKILKGFIEKDLINGSATFEKIQIKEVTSHFRNGWVFFVVYPKMMNNPNNNILLGGNGTVVNSQKIKPLILEKVIVKAKKAKERDGNDENLTTQEEKDEAKDDTIYG